jgi:leucyl-tRNA synthetase
MKQKIIVIIAVATGILAVCLSAAIIARKKAALENEQIQKALDGKPVKKVIVIKGRLVNIIA